jgi:lipoyl(octanoyl) transferase
LPTHTLEPIRHFNVLDLGLRDYGEVLKLQYELVDERKKGGPDTLVLVEHPPVVTIGREHKGPRPAAPIPLYEVERGGRETYHGPGQLVGYPILDLAARGWSPETYLRRLENALIETVRPWTEARRLKGFTGVWVGRKKLASIGVAVRGTVAYHGFALNISTDLTGFKVIHPCGLEPDTMTSLERLAGRPVKLEDVKAMAVLALSERL